MDGFDTDCQLLTVSEKIEGADVRLAFGDGRREIYSRTVPLAQLRKQGLAAAMAEKPGQLLKRFDATAGADAGHALCEWLFGDNAAQCALIRALQGNAAQGLEPNVRAVRLRLELSFSHDELLEQPWHLLSWMGQRLITSGWVIYLAPKEHKPEDGSFAWPPQVLLIAPEVGDGIDTQAHVREVDCVLQDAGIPRNSVKRVGTREELKAACAGQRFDLVYFYGHGDATGDSPRVMLAIDDFGDRKPDPLSIAELEQLLPRTGTTQLNPLIVYLNTCQTGAGGFHGAGNMLCGRGRVVLSHLCAVEASTARARAQRFFQQLLLKNRSPVDAFMPEQGKLPSDPLAWMAGAVHSSIRGWSSPRERSAQVSHDERWPERLDRDRQRSSVTDVIRTSLIRNSLAPRQSLTPEQAEKSPLRGVAFVAVAQEGNLLRRHGTQLFTFIKDDLGLGRPCFQIEVEVPKQQEPMTPEWNECLLSALNAAPGDQLSSAVRGYLRKESIEDGDALLWIDFGGWPRPEHQKQPSIKKWVEACRHWLATIDAGPKLRFGFFSGSRAMRPTARRCRKA